MCELNESSYLNLNGRNRYEMEGHPLKPTDLISGFCIVCMHAFRHQVPVYRQSAGQNRSRERLRNSRIAEAFMMFTLESLKLCCNLATILDVVGNNFFELCPNECNLFIVLALCKINRVNMSICLYTPNATSTASGFICLHTNLLLKHLQLHVYSVFCILHVYSANGNFTNHKENLKEKTKRSFFATRRYLDFLKLPIYIINKLFNTLFFSTFKLLLRSLGNL